MNRIADANLAMRSGQYDVSLHHCARGLTDEGLPVSIRRQYALNLLLLVRRLARSQSNNDNTTGIVYLGESASPSAKLIELATKDIVISRLVDISNTEVSLPDRQTERGLSVVNEVPVRRPYDLIMEVIQRRAISTYLCSPGLLELVVGLLFQRLWGWRCGILCLSEGRGEMEHAADAKWFDYASEIFPSVDLEKVTGSSPFLPAEQEKSSVLGIGDFGMFFSPKAQSEYGVDVEPAAPEPWNALAPLFDASLFLGNCHLPNRRVLPGKLIGDAVRLDRTRPAAPTLGSVDNYLDLLTKERLIKSTRNDQSKPESRKELTTKCKPTPLPTARPSIFWGRNQLQVLGKDSEPYPHHEYLNIDQARRRLEEHTRGASPGNTIYVAMPSYNSNRFLDEAIASIVSQKGAFKIRLHIQDGGSIDGTLQTIKQWQSRINNDPESIVNCRGVTVTVASGIDSGMYDAIQNAFRLLEPPDDAVCTWLNSDDLFSPGSFATAFSLFSQQDDVYWAIGNISSCKEDGTVNNDFFQMFPRDVVRRGLCDHHHWRFIQQEGSFWRAVLWNAVGGLNTRLKLAGDWDLWRRFAQLTDPIHFGAATARFRISEKQQSKNITAYYKEIGEVLSEDQRKINAENMAFFSPEAARVVATDKISGIVNLQRIPLGEKYIHYANKLTERLTSALTNNMKKRPIKVLTFNTLSTGGAGTGTLRRVQALRSVGVDARLVSLSTVSDQQHVGQLLPPLDALPKDAISGSFEDTRQALQQNVRRALFDSIRDKVVERPGFSAADFFSHTHGLVDALQLTPLIAEFDIIHLHWIAGMFPISSLAAALKDKPIVWTTADMNPFSGGCHYSEGCSGFMKDCGTCPLLGNDQEFTRKAWLEKRDAYANLNITVVCPTEHIARIARRSSLFKDREIIVIPNAYPTNDFRRVAKQKARIALGLSADIPLVAFGSESLRNQRKGADMLPEAIRLAAEQLGIEFEVLAFGRGTPNLPVKVHAMGPVAGARLSLAYSAADAFLSLSREDVGPMTVVESMLCGTPVIGFPVGVLGEVGQHRQTTYLARPFDVNEIVSGLSWALGATEELRRERGARCREQAMQYGDPLQAAERHQKLYERLLLN